MEQQRRPNVELECCWRGYVRRLARCVCLGRARVDARKIDLALATGRQ